MVGLGNLIGFLSGWTSTDGGTIAVIRNGGWFDNRDVRQVIQPGSSLTFVGEYSAEHDYPAQQRYYTITSRANGGDRPGVDVVTVPTQDGVNVGIEGTLYFTLNLSPKLMIAFDDRFGTRTFPGFDGNQHYAWDGNTGWSAFLDQIVRPVIDNDLRAQISGFKCAQLVSSCALVQNQGSQTSAQVAQAGQSNNSNIALVQQAINSSLTADLNTTLGDPFLQGITFRLVRITLPDNVQAAVDAAQAAFAKVTEAQAQVQQAQLQAAANAARQRGYNACPTCQVIDELHALPPGLTTYAPGAGAGIAIGGGTK
jgi:hypothetical protein